MLCVHAAVSMSIIYSLSRSGDSPSWTLESCCYYWEWCLSFGKMQCLFVWLRLSWLLQDILPLASNKGRSICSTKRSFSRFYNNCSSSLCFNSVCEMSLPLQCYIWKLNAHCFQRDLDRELHNLEGVCVWCLYGLFFLSSSSQSNAFWF
jgi:hypothetical protein